MDAGAALTDADAKAHDGIAMNARQAVGRSDAATLDKVTMTATWTSMGRMFTGAYPL